MTHIVDTSILIRQTDTRSADRPLAVRATRNLLQSGEELNTFAQNMIEFWAVATRPFEANGLNMSPAQADAERRRWEAAIPLRFDPPDVYARWVYLVNQYNVSGKPTHDARIVAAMLAHGLTHILTFNGRDFRRFAPEGIVVVDPAEVA